MDPLRLRDYLQRIGIPAGGVQKTPDGLRALHVAHLDAVPFENLDIHLGRWIDLDVDRIIDKLCSGRGGFCYELNGAFAALLGAFGFDVSLLEARVYVGEEPGVRFDHLVLRVDLDEPWLVDVGFGQSFREPLPLRLGEDLVDPNGTYRIEPNRPGWLDLYENGARRFAFGLEPHVLADFEPGCRYHQTSPDSHFTRNPVCSRPTPRGRVTLRGTTLIETVGPSRAESILAEADLLEVYRTRFGVVLSRIPGP